MGGRGGRRGFGCLLTLPLWYPAGSAGGQSPAYLAFSLLLCPHPPAPLPLRGRGGLKVILCKGLRPLHPRGCTHGSPRKRQEAVPYEQCRQPRRGGTGGDGTIRRKRRRRLRWSSPPGQGEPVPQGFSHPSAHHSGRANKCRRGASPHCVFHSGRDSRCRRRQKPTPLPSFPFPQQSPHKENHAVDERREENRQNNMRENTEPEKADRRNRTRRESRGKHAE